MQSISGFRFSLRWVFSTVAFAAVAAAALTDGAARWSALLVLTSQCALLASILGFRVAFANDIDALRRHWQRGMLAKWLKFL
jgi:hypothetical protein